MTEKTVISSREEMEAILRQGGLGYLALSRDDEPYVVPLNYAYQDGTIVFHCAYEGRKIDYLRTNPRVCFAVGRQTGQTQDHGGAACEVDNDSVLCYGTARPLEDLNERARALNAFNRTFRPGADDLSLKRVENCNVIEIRIEEMTGRREHDRTTTRWHWTFES
jgi:hypothetical protein